MTFRGTQRGWLRVCSTRWTHPSSVHVSVRWRGARRPTILTRSVFAVTSRMLDECLPTSRAARVRAWYSKARCLARTRGPNSCTLSSLEWCAIFNDLEWLLTQISRACHHSTLTIQETVPDSGYYKPVESDLWPLNRAIANHLFDLQRHFSYFRSKISVAYRVLLVFLIKKIQTIERKLAALTAGELQWPWSSFQVQTV